ncbi:MAG: hypothetical protein IKN73_02165 [Alphaproteobacteria bacterium]|nr:hypothetical protein [Alphaproteobacteria bacterium]
MKIINVFGKSVVSVAVLAAFGACYAADNGRNGNRSMMPSVTMVNASARMPVQNVTGLSVINNPAVTTTDVPVQVVQTQHIVPTPTPTPTPEPEPVKECEDGGVKNSEYTASMCRNDLLNCINSGALPSGLNDMYNEEVRNSIMSGMRLCQDVVDKCIKDVREDCKSVYASNTDVWMDFNCRVVQPEYYNFVLRKTGLTPNQAENTCLLLDKNTYGAAFAAVSDQNDVNAEYNKGIGAYNSANGGTLSKDNPQGVVLNTTGYDGNRGHYARWDATKAECLIRVGAYNKDKNITNSWLFGAVGNDNVAEVWQKAGSSFTCSKDLFGFSLLNDTKTAAVIGVGGGTVLGASIDAAAGAGVYAKKKAEYDDLNDGDACNNPEFIKKLVANIGNKNDQDLLRSFAYSNVVLDRSGDKVVVDTAKSTPVFATNDDILNMDEEGCRSIVYLNSKIKLYEDAMEKCDNEIKITIENNLITQDVKQKLIKEMCKSEGNLTNAQLTAIGCDEDVYNAVKEKLKVCSFKPLQLGLMIESETPYCDFDGRCKTKDEIAAEIKSLKSLLARILPNKGSEPNKGKEIGKGLGIGAAAGAGAGGLATMITAFVERSHITCKVGDGLNSIALGKSYTIDSLKDFYIKWNLHLPDSAIPSGTGSNATYSNSLEAMCYNFDQKKSAK